LSPLPSSPDTLRTIAMGQCRSAAPREKIIGRRSNPSSGAPGTIFAKASHGRQEAPQVIVRPRRAGLYRMEKRQLVARRLRWLFGSPGRPGGGRAVLLPAGRPSATPTLRFVRFLQGFSAKGCRGRAPTSSCAARGPGHRRGRGDDFASTCLRRIPDLRSAGGNARQQCSAAWARGARLGRDPCAGHWPARRWCVAVTPRPVAVLGSEAGPQRLPREGPVGVAGWF